VPLTIPHALHSKSKKFPNKGDRYKVTFSSRSNFMLDSLQSFYGCISKKNMRNSIEDQFIFFQSQKAACQQQGTIYGMCCGLRKTTNNLFIAKNTNKIRSQKGKYKKIK
jgi:hypothetical protein